MLMQTTPEPPLQVEHEELELQQTSDANITTAPQPRLSIEFMEGPFGAGMADAATAAMGRPEFELERTSEPPVDAGTVTPAEIETYGELDLNQAAPEEVVADGLVLEEPAALAPDPGIEIEGLARTQYEGSGMFQVDNAPPAPAEPVESFEDRPTNPVADLPLIMPDELEPAPWAAARPSRETEPIEAPPAPAAAAPPPLRLPDDDGAADTAALSQAEPVVTETMAELYLRQGHREDALHVYEALAAQRPQDARLRQKVLELSAPPSRGRPSGSGQSAGAFLKGILNARPGAPAPALPPEPPPARPSAPPRPSGPPTSVRDEAANAEELPEQSSPAPGSPTRPASDAISLDSVFGEEGGRGSVPALPEPMSDAANKAPTGSGGFSFDDFFGTAAAPSPGQEKSAAQSARPPRPSGRNRSPEQEEDLDQFQAWLKSLKA
jgi:hypothetical protein